MTTLFPQKHNANSKMSNSHSTNNNQKYVVKLLW